MRLEMVDADEGHAGRERHALGDIRADQQPTDQPRPDRRRHAGEIARRQPRLLEHRAQQARQHGEMGPRGDLRHDAAEGRVIGDLARHAFGQDHAVGIEDRAGGLVAGGLDAQHRPGRSLRRCRSGLLAVARLASGHFSFHALAFNHWE
jgi:hypothetical protein